MGGAVSVELNKPVDASDIKQTNSLEIAGSEVKRLRSTLGHLAKKAGIDLGLDDASDIILGVDDKEDFERCIKEIAHIRKCLQLNTQSQRRATRSRSDININIPQQHLNNLNDIYAESKYDDNSDSSTESDEDK